MNPNVKTVLALSYRANDIQAATDRRRRDLAVGETRVRPGAKPASSETETNPVLATVRRLLPRLV